MPAPEHQLTLQSAFGAGTIEYALITNWAADIEAQSGGRLAIEVFGPGELVGAFEIEDAIKSGQIDLGFTWLSLTELRQQTEALNMPFSTRLGSSSSSTVWSIVNERFQDSISGVDLLSAYVGGVSGLFSTLTAAGIDPIGFNGAKVSGNYWTNTLRDYFFDIGISPTFVAESELYLVLLTGAIDAVVSTPSFAEFLPATNGIIFNGHVGLSSNTTAILANESALANLPPDLRQIILDNSGSEFAVSAGQSTLDDYLASVQSLIDSGMTVDELNATETQVWKDGALPATNARLAELDQLGIPATEIFQELISSSAGPTQGDDVLSGSQAADTIDGLGGNDQISGLGGDDILAGGDGNDLIDGGEGNDILNGGAGWDTLNGNSGEDTLSGGDGNDQLNGGWDDDTLNGGADNDTLNGSHGRDTLNGDDGNDTLNGGDFGDILNGGSGNDILNGNAGWDTLNGNSGEDTLSGGDGDDRLNGGWDDDTLNGGHGNDTLDGSHGRDTLNGNDGNDTLSGGDFGDILNGGSGNDILNGGAGWDTLNGNSGEDTLSGGDGDDRLNGGWDDDILYGGRGNDTLDGSHGKDTLNGNNGNDILRGGDFGDTLNGGNGNDTLNGDAGWDVLNGGAGNDFLFGGSGNDTFVFSDSGDRDTIADFEDGLDTIVIANGATSFAQVTASDAGADTILQFNGTQVTLANVDHTLIGSDDFSFV